MPYELTVIGGGTGSFNVLSGLRPHRAVALRSIVSMMDSGGDSGQLRDAFGVLPPGDLRRCLVALSEESGLLRDLFSFRFEEEPLAGRNFGNLFFLALTRALGGEEAAVDALGRLLEIRGQVIPVTWEHAELVAELESGELLQGESAIDRRHGPDPVGESPVPIRSARLEPAVRANPRALEALAASDVIVLAPGDVYTSTVPNLLVAGVPEAIRGATRATLVQCVNLMTKRGETDGWTASRHVEEVARYSGRVPDALLVHSGALPPERLRDYAREGAAPVRDDLSQLEARGVVVRRAELATPHGLVHHEPGRVAGALLELVGELRARRTA